MRISLMFGAILTALFSLWGVTSPATQVIGLTNGRISFDKPPDLLSTVTTYNDTNVWGAQYFFTVSLPEKAGKPLGRVTVNQRQGFEEIRFKVEDTEAFEGTPRHKGRKLDLKEVTKDTQTPTISVTFDPPVQPGTTVTIRLRPIRNPSVGGVYIFGVTAFPAVENPYGLYLGIGRLHFYESSPIFH